MFLFLGFLFALAGCADENGTAPCEPCGATVVEGVVTSAGEPVAAIVAATQGPLPFPWGWNTYTATADSTGYYRLSLPAGSYILSFDPPEGVEDFGGAIYWSPTGFVSLFRNAGELIIGDPGEPIRIDLPCGEVDFEVRQPDESAGVGVGLGPVDSPYNAIWTGYSLHHPVVLRARFIPPGLYRIQGAIGGNQLWLPATFELADAELLEVPAGGRVSHRSTIPAVGKIHGRVVGSWREFGIHRFRIRPVTSDSTEISPDVVLEDDGHYTVSFHAPVQTRLRVSIDDVDGWVGGGSFATATVFDVGPGVDLQAEDRVECGLRITFSSEDTLDTSSRYLTLVGPDGRESRVYTGVEPVVALSNLDPGIWRLRIEPGILGSREWAAQWFNGRSTQEAADPIVFSEPGQILDLEVRLARGGRIQGTVRDWNDAPLSSIGVGILEDADPADRPAHFLIFENGRYELTGLADGAYQLCATPDGDRLTWYPGAADRAAASSVEVRGGETVTGIDWALIRPEGRR